MTHRRSATARRAIPGAILPLGVSFLGFLAAWSAACSSDPDGSAAATGAGGGAASGASGTGASAAGAGGFGNTAAGFPAGGSSGAGAGTSGDAGEDVTCAAVQYAAEPIPFDIFIMFDQSSSMNELSEGGKTRWEVVTTALKETVQSPQMNGIGVGIQYFANYCPPQDPGNPDPCNVACYSTAEVPIAPLPGNAAAIVDSLSKHTPGTLTPTEPALYGAIEHARQWAFSHPGTKVVVLLMSDGYPTQCGQVSPGDFDTGAPASATNAAKIAKAGFEGSPSIPTYVIGINSPNLNAIAQQGGGLAFNADDANASQQIKDALATIKNNAGPCDYEIPTPDEGYVDYDKINVQFSAGSAKQIVPQVPSKAECGPSGGWYYDDPAKPTKIHLCPATCTLYKTTSGGVIDVLVGCKTVVFNPN